MSDYAYTKGFLGALSCMEKRAAGNSQDEARVKGLDSIFKDDAKKMGLEEPEPYRNPANAREAFQQSVGRIGTHLNSLGRGVLSAVGVTGARAAQSALSMAGWIPRMADSLVLGKLLGVGGGQGLTGRLFGTIDRNIDRAVHGMRNWSSSYDEKHHIGGGFNRFINGALADSVGGFTGFGGLMGLIKKQKLPVIMAGAFGGAMPLFSGSQKELRDREAWIRSLDPRDRLRMDPTSTATNQENAPTPEEYRRYHTPLYGMPASVTGYVRIPYRWRHQSNGGSPVQFREYGT